LSTYSTRKEIAVKNAETKSGFRVARSIATIVIALAVVTSFVIFGRFQEQSKYLLDAYLSYVNSMGPGTPVYTIIRTVLFIF